MIVKVQPRAADCGQQAEDQPGTKRRSQCEEEYGVINIDRLEMDQPLPGAVAVGDKSFQNGKQDGA